MKIQILKNETYEDLSHLPNKATDRSTGYDIIASSDPEIIGVLNDNGSYSRIDYIQYKTNLRVAVKQEIQSIIGFGNEVIDYDILGLPRSSVSKYNLQLANSICLIDADYRGEILVRFNYIWQPEDYSINNVSIEGRPNFNKIYKKGDAICQLKITKVENVKFELVNELDSTNRGTGGFGSSDIKRTEKTELASKHMSMIESMYNNVGNTTPIKKYSELVKEKTNI